MQRLLAAATPRLDAHLERLGPVPVVGAAELAAMVEAAGLTGRGGGGFPTARKLAAVASGGRSVVIGNGAEGEPASSKDRALLLNAPHLVLDGLTLAARVVGATRAYLYAPADLCQGVLADAVGQRRDRPGVTLVPAADTFVSGQESAVVAAVEGRPALPTSSLTPVYVRGVGGRPTLVQNVETLAQLALVARYGPAWFRLVGTPDEPGTRLLTVSGAVARPGVYEVAGGSALADVLGVAGGASEPVRAVLVGGYHGGWVPFTRETADLPLTGRALAPWDAAPGAGVIVALPSSRCGLRAGADIAAYLAGQNAGQCGPCRNGLPTVAAHLRALAVGRASRPLIGELHRVVGLVDGRGACAHPTGTARFVRSTLRAFGDDVEAHLHGGCVATGRATGRPVTRSDRGRR